MKYNTARVLRHTLFGWQWKALTLVVLSLVWFTSSMVNYTNEQAAKRAERVQSGETVQYSSADCTVSKSTITCLVEK